MEANVTEMRAMEFTETSGNFSLRMTTRPLPQPAEGEILIQVHAAGVTPTEKLWYPTSHRPDGSLRMRAIPGHEFSGIVAALGPGTTGYQPGDRVFGLNDWFAEGATAEFCITKPAFVAPKPSSLSHVEAASTPIGSLTAWQGLHARANVKMSERVLIHGGAGAVGLFAVQMAKLQGAYVIATASAANTDLVKQLGADEVIDYQTRRFERDTGKVDVIFDTVGGDTLERSWDLLNPGGQLVTIAADAESDNDPRVKGAFFIVEPKGDQLASIAALIDSGMLKAFVKAEVPLDEADRAYSGSIAGKPGKIVILTL
jgi:NADPH:quinone reductase-like Zn-dependent oxidoreductase